MNASIKSKTELADGLWLLHVSSNDSELPSFVPGQYAELGLPENRVNGGTGDSEKIVRRAYSIASSPSESESLEFYIVEVDGGALTPVLCKLDVGQKVWLGPKIKGKFTLDGIDFGKNLIMVSTGTGIAPFISMLREFRSQGRWKNFVVIHGARFARDLGYQEELRRVASEDSSVHYIPAVTREPDDSKWQGERGRVGGLLVPEKFKELTGFELDPKTCEVFLCGNPDMIESLREQLAEHGFKKHSRRNPGNLHFERYW